MLFQQLVNRMCSHCLFPSLLTSCQRLVDNLLQGCWAQQTCYKLFQQLVIVLQFNNFSTSCEWQPALLQLVDELATSLLRTYLVDKLWDFYVCSSANTSCWQVVGTALLQVCRRFVTTCAFWQNARKNLTFCNKSVNRLCSHCLSQVVNRFGTSC
jgi:hypothetical protein